VATVKLHVQAILNITGARNRTEAAMRARDQVR
jgi:DNA-binding NarL/FixJ family response regulator